MFLATAGDGRPWPGQRRRRRSQHSLSSCCVCREIRLDFFKRTLCVHQSTASSTVSLALPKGKWGETLQTHTVFVGLFCLFVFFSLAVGGCSKEPFSRVFYGQKFWPSLAVSSGLCAAGSEHATQGCWRRRLLSSCAEFSA